MFSLAEHRTERTRNVNASNPIPTDYETFRASIRSFLKEALTPELVRAGERTTSVFSDFEAGRQWQSILHAKGWGAPEWPMEHGGTGWDIQQCYIFLEECKLANAPNPVMMGVQMLGPIPNASRPSGNAITHDVETIAVNNNTTNLAQLDIVNLAVAADSPRLDSVVVVDRPRAARCHQLSAAGLDIAGAVSDPGLQQCLITLPNPIKVKPGERLGQYRPLKTGLTPLTSTVNRDLDTLYRATATPGETRDVVVTLLQQLLPPRGRRDDRLCLLNGGVLPVRAIRHQIHVVRDLVFSRPRGIAYFQSS